MPSHVAAQSLLISKSRSRARRGWQEAELPTTFSLPRCEGRRILSLSGPALLIPHLSPRAKAGDGCSPVCIPSALPLLQELRGEGPWQSLSTMETEASYLLLIRTAPPGPAESGCRNVAPGQAAPSRSEVLSTSWANGAAGPAAGSPQCCCV